MKEVKNPAVYIMTNKRNGTLYSGVTSSLVKRVHEHKTSATKGFADKHDYKVLVWYEQHNDMSAAITREKQIKAGSRKKKLALIETMNPEWNDLNDSIL